MNKETMIARHILKKGRGNGIEGEGSMQKYGYIYIWTEGEKTVKVEMAEGERRSKNDRCKPEGLHCFRQYRRLI